ncbi:hypothetical protein ACQPYK_50330 (plasmid) [Streptosporangium sp. CA-135522]|uniref:hypothetical protein n=1 Tax=Streptosporangium sp. CA-135522 TaxID=3240072 RepID=UPI003D8FFA0E
MEDVTSSRLRAVLDSGAYSATADIAALAGGSSDAAGLLVGVAEHPGDEVHGVAEGAGGSFQVREDLAPVRSLVHVDPVLGGELAGELTDVLSGFGQLVQHGPDAHPAGRGGAEPVEQQRTAALADHMLEQVEALPSRYTLRDDQEEDLEYRLIDARLLLTHVFEGLISASAYAGKYHSVIGHIGVVAPDAEG